MKVKMAAAILAAGVMVAGCQSGQSANQTASQTGQSQQVAWKLHLTSKCTQSAPEQCVASYGFTVLADGTYQVGPGPQGQVLRGQLTPAELASVKKVLDPVLPTVDVVPAPGQTCEAQTLADASDLIVLDRHGAKKDLIHSEATNYCFKTSQRKQAEDLQKALLVLASKYYSLPFPDACLDAVHAVEALYAPLQKCTTSADCTYLDNTYFPIESYELQLVETQDCSVITPLPVANKALALAHRNELLKARDNAREVCGARIARAGCTSAVGFQSNQGAPVCDAGACRINPAILGH